MRKFINAVNGNPEAKKELDNWGLSFADNTIDVRILVMPCNISEGWNFFVEKQPCLLYTISMHML